MRTKSDKQFNLRIPKELYVDFRERCEQEGITVANALKNFMNQSNEPAWNVITPPPAGQELEFKWKEGFKPANQSSFVTGLFTTRGECINGYIYGQVFDEKTNQSYDLTFFDKWRHKTT